jgi:hypothetical protein
MLVIHNDHELPGELRILRSNIGDRSTQFPRGNHLLRPRRNFERNLGQNERDDRATAHFGARSRDYLTQGRWKIKELRIHNSHRSFNPAPRKSAIWTTAYRFETDVKRNEVVARLFSQTIGDHLTPRQIVA